MFSLSPKPTKVVMAQDQVPNSKSCKQQAQNNSLIGRGATVSSRAAEEAHQKPTVTFSIATPTVTTILPMTENISDTSFMLPATSYQHDSMMENSYSLENKIDQMNQALEVEHNSVEEMSNQAEIIDNDQTKEKDQQQSHSCHTEPNSDKKSVSADHHQVTISQADGSKGCKKRNKVIKKSTKLDAKSKLEKSRQSARECRARKKLRYQYLEDLVTNREKAVIKLREELSMFCELSQRIDIGSINEADRKLLIDQTKENSMFNK